MGCASSAAMKMVGKGPGEEKVAGGVRTLVKSTDNINQGITAMNKQNNLPYPTDGFHKKDGIMQQVHGVGDSVVKKVSMVVQDIEDNVESAFDHVKHGAEELGESITGGVKTAAEKVQHSIGVTHTVAESVAATADKELKVAEDTLQSKVDAFQEIADEVADNKASENIEANLDIMMGGKMESAKSDSIDELIASLTDTDNKDKQVEHHINI